MPFPVAILVAFALGAVFARAARADLARHDGPLLASRAAAIVATFAAAVVAPIVGYFAALHGRSCRLTPLGRHYRRMAEKGLL